MKSQNIHLLLGVLLFASLCGAPRTTRKKQVDAGLKTSARLVEDKMPSVFGVMSNARKQKPKAPKSKLSKEIDLKAAAKKAEDEHKAATKIQAAVRGHQARKKLVKSEGSSATVSSRSSSRSPKISTPRPASKKAQKAATKARRMKELVVNDAPVADPTDAFVG